MKFLIDMNMPRRVGNRLNAEGHEYRHAGEIGLAKASDATIIEEARRNNEVIVTHDLDYSHLLAFSGKPDPSVIIFRLKNTHTDNLADLIINSFKEIEKPLKEGCIVVIEDAAVRIRRLPISKGIFT